jgi:hypothetical protein
MARTFVGIFVLHLSQFSREALVTYFFYVETGPTNEKGVEDLEFAFKQLGRYIA